MSIRPTGRINFIASQALWNLQKMLRIEKQTQARRQLLTPQTKILNTGLPSLLEDTNVPNGRELASALSKQQMHFFKASLYLMRPKDLRRQDARFIPQNNHLASSSSEDGGGRIIREGKGRGSLQSAFLDTTTSLQAPPWLKMGLLREAGYGPLGRQVLKTSTTGQRYIVTSTLHPSPAISCHPLKSVHCTCVDSRHCSSKVKVGVPHWWLLLHRERICTND